MTPAEVHIVKRRISCYRDLLQLADEKDRESFSLAIKYQDIAGVKGINLDPKVGTSGGFQDKTHIYTQIFADQVEAERSASEYRRQAAEIRAFVNAIEDERKIFLIKAYIDGMRYHEIGNELGYTPQGVHKAIAACLETVPSEMASISGLL